MNRSIAAAAAGLLLLSGCALAPEDLQEPQPAATQAAPTPPVAEAEPAPPPAAVTPAPRDACGASELQNLIGHPKTEVPVPLHPEHQRVACTTCPLTQEYDPTRLNFFFDAQTGLIKEIRCG